MLFRVWYLHVRKKVLKPCPFIGSDPQNLHFLSQFFQSFFWDNFRDFCGYQQRTCSLEVRPGYLPPSILNIYSALRNKWSIRKNTSVVQTIFHLCLHISAHYRCFKGHKIQVQLRTICESSNFCICMLNVELS